MKRTLYFLWLIFSISQLQSNVPHPDQQLFDEFLEKENIKTYSFSLHTHCEILSPLLKNLQQKLHELSQTTESINNHKDLDAQAISNLLEKMSSIKSLIETFYSHRKAYGIYHELIGASLHSFLKNHPTLNQHLCSLITKSMQEAEQEYEANKTILSKQETELQKIEEHINHDMGALSQLQQQFSTQS